MRSLVSCLCCTYNRVSLLGESIKCFLDQDYENKELIIINDQEGVNLRLDPLPDNIQIYEHPVRFTSLGQKRNYLKSLAHGEYCCIWDDDDLYVPYRLSESVDLMEKYPQYDIIKPKDSFVTFDGIKYKLATNRFHAQAIIRRKYMDENQYPLISLGEDAGFEKNAEFNSRLGYIDIFPSFWSVFRCSADIFHLSSVKNPALEKQAWENAKMAALNGELKGEILLEPKFQKDYWAEIKTTLNRINGFWGYEFYEKIGRKNECNKN